MKAVQPQLVKSSENLLPYVIYRTKNYDIFKPFPYNRGVESGIKESKVKTYMNLMLKDDFEFEMFVVLINEHNQMMDGHNRFEAARRLGKDIYFRVLFGDKWQKQETALPAIAKINNTNSIWTNSEIFNTAIALNSELALTISRMISKASKAKFAVNEKSLTMSHVFTLLYRKTGHPSRIPLDDFFNTDYLAYCKTEQFKKEFDFCCYLINRFADTFIDLTRVYEAILPMVWKGECDMEKFMRNSHKVKFGEETDTKVKGIKYLREKINEVMKYK